MDHALTRGDPSRRAQRRAPQDEVGDYSTASKAGIWYSTVPTVNRAAMAYWIPAFAGMTTARGTPQRVTSLRWALTAPTTICEKSKLRRRQSTQTPVADSIRPAP